MSTATETKKPSALDTLKSLGQKKPAASGFAISATSSDPAIAGAKLGKGSSNVVTLGLDPAFTEKAAQCAGLKAAMEQAEAEFKVLQAEARDYGAAKREIYNTTFKSSVTTVKVPYEVDTPTGKEVKTVSVICSNKYSLVKEIVLGHKDALGDAYDRLFKEESTKALKPNAEELIRGILSEIGLKPEEVESSMENLFEETVKVSATENYEFEVKKVPDHLRAILDQAVTRAQPGLKFA
jgi:hypothetical protein